MMEKKKMIGRRAFLAGAFGVAVTQLNVRAFAQVNEKLSTDFVSVNAPDGAVRGVAYPNYNVFKGIPFAQPPVGALRFRQAVPMPRSSGVRSASSFGPAPMQERRSLPGTRLPMLGDAKCSEDCLYLNVWAPREAGPHPVFVWIYGGGNTFGATSQAIYDGSAFARDGVVCVTIGYRIGAFGFLELGEILGGEYQGSGNNPLHDQILGLQWVRNNIAAFGGDPDRVTVAGESAGAKNVSALLSIPAARGLFQSAIVQSGGGHTVHNLDEAHGVADLFMGEFAKAGLRREDLLRVGSDDLLKVQTATVAAYPRAFAFRSVVDGKTMLQRPIDSVTAGYGKDVRLLIGTNRDESVLFFPQDLVESHNSDPKADRPISSKELANIKLDTLSLIADKYAHAFPALSPFERRVRLVTAEEYWIPTVRLAEAHAASGGETYAFRFERPIAEGRYAGLVPHTSELPLVWDNFQDPAFRDLFYRGASAPEAFAKQVHSAWVSFIKGSPPAAEGLPTWQRYETTGSESRRTMLLQDQPVMVSDPSSNERQIWNGVM
ncbi:carboxylesterase/lipase family protein [Paraburkholderia sp. BR14263]|uniref:carboxylesterase/lipase family protein n=1 Tax=unclassified Paraburkholderia TaxID=2615204 RepID=UPI0034CD986D